MDDDSPNERVISTGLGYLEEIIAPAQAQREAEDAGLHFARGSNNAKSDLYSQLLQLSDGGISLSEQVGNEGEAIKEAHEQHLVGSQGEPKTKVDETGEKEGRHSQPRESAQSVNSGSVTTPGRKKGMQPQVPSVDVMRDDFLLGEFDATSMAAIVTDGTAEAVLFFVRESVGLFGSLSLRKNKDGEGFDVAVHEIAKSLVAPSKVEVVDSKVYVLERGESEWKNEFRPHALNATSDHNAGQHLQRNGRISVYDASIENPWLRPLVSNLDSPISMTVSILSIPRLRMRDRTKLKLTLLDRSPNHIGSSTRFHVAIEEVTLCLQTGA